MAQPVLEHSFPPEFVWGASTSAYQIEGAAEADGKGPSIWDEFCRRDDVIQHGDSGATACDHYHRYAADVPLMEEIDLGAYRFSISWPRVLPEGDGEANAAGLDFYDRLVDALLAAEIEPWVTLFHWDYPLALQRRGGWLSDASPRWFAQYVRIVVERLSDRVTRWITINEPQVFLDYGHRKGEHAPGLRLSLAEQLRAAHHVLLAHGRGVAAIRECAKRPPVVGWAPAAVSYVPRDASVDADVAAARSKFAAVDRRSLWNNAWFNDPAIFGKYPDAGLIAYGDAVPAYSADDMACIGQPLDFLGINVYSAEVFEAGSDAPVACPAGAPRNTFDWPVVPESLYWTPRFFHERYDTPLVITENGLAAGDWVSLDGAVHDPQRIDYTTRYLRELRRATADGVDVRGYFHWSLLDNFEWAAGYGRRFGLVDVDFASQVRTLKDSARWYGKLIAANRSRV